MFMHGTKKILKVVSAHRLRHIWKHKIESIVLSCVLVSGSASLCAQTTIHVPQEQPTIQSAINAAKNGDTVLVADGTYKENIDFKGKAITVTSVNGAGASTIDGGAADTVVKFLNSEGPGSVLNGFTITNGAINPNSLDNGGGILVGLASPRITNNVVTKNAGCQGGYGIFVAGGGPLIQGNLISNNFQSGACGGGLGGGGIGVQGSSGLQITGNVIANNVAIFGGAITLFASTIPVLIQNNIMIGNDGGQQGGGIWMVNESPALIVQNLFIHNKGSEGGAIFTSASGAGMVVLNNTMADNPSSEGSGLYGEFPADATIQNNLIIGAAGASAVFCDFGNLFTGHVIANDIFTTGNSAVDATCTNPLGSNGNVSVDPLFIDPASDNYHLRAGSPAIDTGSNLLPATLPSTDLSGNPRTVNGTVDLGAFELSSNTGAFTLTAEQGAPTSMTVAAGQTATYHLAITGSTGFAATVSMACSGAPAGATCTATPASLFVNEAGGGSVTVAVHTASRAGGGGGLPWTLPTLCLLLCAASACLLTGQRARLRYGLAAACLMTLLLVGCGGGSGGANSAGASTLVVTATSGTSTQSISLTLQVE